MKAFAVLFLACAITGNDPSDLDPDGDGVEWSEDCDNASAASYPGAAEHDTGCTRDADGDGWGDASASGGVAPGADCDDADADVHPGAVEICDEVDQDCDGVVDEGLTEGWHLDGDGDGFGDPEQPATDCGLASGVVEDDSDCDDADASAWPGAAEYDGAGCTRDADGDGWGDADASGAIEPGTDCEDSDAEIHPGVDEVCDGEDEDCDGAVDEEAVDASSWYADADNDGHGGGEPVSACEQPSGYLAGGEDCDDGDASVYPGAIEVCGDGAVNDCEGSVAQAIAACSEVDLADADAKLYGAGQTGFAVAGAGDVDGDGFDDLIVGAPVDGHGHAYLVRGPVSGDLDLTTDPIKGLPGVVRFDSEGEGDQVGCSVAGAGDVNGDGFQDVLVGARFAGAGGAAYLILGPVSDTNGNGEFALGGADVVFDAEDASDETGWSVAGAGDTDGDGLDDLLVGARSGEFDPESLGDAGLVYLLRSPASGDLSSADSRLQGVYASSYAGESVASAGDVDGDGLADLLIGAPDADQGPKDQGNQAGAAYLVSGLVTGDLELSDADARLIGEDAEDRAGRSVAGAGDVDGDGFADLLIGAPYSSRGDDAAGVAYLVVGAVSGEVGLDEVDATTMLGVQAGALTGHAVAGVGDVDVDGFADLLIGTPQDGRDYYAGVVYLILGGLDTASAGAVYLNDAFDQRLLGEFDGDYAGWAVAGAGDTNGDGLPELLIGANGGAEDAGAAYLIANLY